MNGGVINTLRLVNHHRKPAFGSTILTENDHSYTERDSGGTVW